VTVDKGVQDVFVGFPGATYRGPSIDIEADQALTIDLSQALPPDVFSLTFDDPMLALETSSSRSSYLMPHSHTVHTIDIEFGVPGVYAAPAAAQRQPGDVVRVEVVQAAGGATRDVVRDMTTPVDVTLEPGPAISMMAPMIDTDAVSQLAVTLPIPPATLGHVMASASFTAQPELTAGHYLHMFVRPGWAAGQATVSLPTPDLRDLADWTVDMEVQAGNPVDWALAVTDQDQPFDAPIGDRTAVENRLSGTVSPRTP
jgi:hypothetical protein